MKSVSVLFSTALITYLSCFLLRRLALKLNILDFPGGRKIHKSATPLLGGLALYIGILCGFIFNLAYLYFLWPVILGSTIILIVGLINDIKEQSIKSRLILQAVAGLIVISSGMRITFLPHALWADILEVIITLLWIVGVTNAFNYLDGLDGLAAGSAVINSFCFIAILYMSHQYRLGLFSIILIAACLGFLPYNFRKEKIFLGEAGSTLLGFILACVSFFGSWAEDNMVKISIPVLILGVPIFDMIFTTVMRIGEGKVKTIIQWLRYADKDHFHHYLLDLGIRPLGAVLLIYCITFALGLSAIMVSNDDSLEALLTLSQAVIVFIVVAILIVMGKKHHQDYNSG